jgi:tetratricopeptide (TPR) repeat protein
MPSESPLQLYEQAIATLETSSSPTPEQVLTVLKSRDQVQAHLADLNAAAVIKLEECDHRLKSHQAIIAQALAQTQSRQTLKPHETAWWWHLEPAPPHPWLDQPEWLWNGITTAALAASGALVLNLWSYFLTGGLTATGGIIFNSLVTLITGGSAFTQIRQTARNDLYTRLKFPKWSWHLISGGGAIALALGLVGARTTLPLLATQYKQSGEQKYRVGQLDTALADYQQAIALRPDYADARYNLALLYEDLDKTDQAIAEYQLAIQNSSQNPITELNANNNLGRLYLLKDDANSAFPPLERAMSLVKTNDLATHPDRRSDFYSALKNMGWLRLLQKRYPEAEALLQQAIELDADRAAAHCLQAQVLEAQKQNQAALKQWESCNRFADRSIKEEDRWIGLANSAPQRLSSPSNSSSPSQPGTSQPGASP